MTKFDEATNKWLAWIADRDQSILEMPEDVQEALRDWAEEAEDDARKAVAWDLMRAVLEDDCGADWFPAWSSAEVAVDADQPANGVMVLNWNQSPVIEQRVFEALGMETDWSDGIDKCSVCDHGVVTQPQFYGWRRKFYAHMNGEVVCFACLDAEESEREAMIEDLLRSSVGRVIPHNRFLPASYVRVDFEGANGFYGGQCDDPRPVGAFLEAQGVSQYLFNITDIGQFDVHFDVWVDSEQEGLLYGIAMQSSCWRRARVFLEDASGEPALFPSPADASAAGGHTDFRWPDGLRGQVEVLAVFLGLADAAAGVDPAEQMKKALVHAAGASREPAPEGSVRYTQLHRDGTSTTRDIPASEFITKGVS